MKVRRRKKGYSSEGELYRIAQGTATVIEKAYPSDGAALSMAQNLLSKMDREEDPKDKVTYRVSRVPVLGPPDPLWDVVLNDGVIVTYIAA